MGYNVVASPDKATTAALQKRGVDLIFSCAVAPATAFGNNSLGYNGSGDWKGQVASGSLEARMASEDQDLIMSAVLAYKEPKDPQVVAADLAMVIGNARTGQAGDNQSASRSKHSRGRR
jgi:hypothetical protein